MSNTEKPWGELIEFVRTFARRWGRLGGDVKEKWDTLRFYVTWHYMFYDLVFPGYPRIKFPTWLFWLDLYVYGKPIFDPIRSIIQRWQMYIYGKTYEKAVKRFPMMRREILSTVDNPELLPEELRREVMWRRFRLAYPGDIVCHRYSDYLVAVVGIDDDWLVIQSPSKELPYLYVYKEHYMFEDGCGIA